VPYAMKKWGKKVYVIAADYKLRPDHTSQWVEEIRHRKTAGAKVSSIDFFPLDRHHFGPTISKDPGRRSRISCGRGARRWRPYLVLSSMGPAGLGMRKSIPMASTTFARGG